MKKCIYLLALLIISSLTICYADEFNSYPQTLIKTFKWGSGKEEFKKGYRDESPSAFTFDASGRMYVGDPTNKRIIAFNESFVFTHDIKNTTVSGYRQIIMDTPSSFIGFSNSDISKIDIKGNTIFDLNFIKLTNANGMRIDKTIILDNKLYILKEDEWYYIENPETVTKENFKLIKVTPIKIKSEGSSRSGNTGEAVIDEKMCIYKDGELLTRDFDMFNENVVTQSPGGSRSGGVTPAKFAKLDLSEFYWATYLGKDRDGNYYWGGTHLVLVFNKDGALLDAFMPDQRKSKLLPAIHPSGDVYYIDHDAKGVYLYKVNRVW